MTPLLQFIAGNLQQQRAALDRADERLKELEAKFRTLCPHPKESVIHHPRQIAEADDWDECRVCGKDVTGLKRETP